MNIKFVQNLIHPVEVIHGDTAWLPPKIETRLFAELPGRIGDWLAGFGRRRRMHIEYRQAIAHLQSLTDEQLRDIGIPRYDIARAVLLGKNGLQ